MHSKELPARSGGRGTPLHHQFRQHESSSVSIHPIDVIQHKRDGLALSDAEIKAFIHDLVHRTPENPTPTDAQAAALLMAIFVRGLNPQELASLTQAMRFSGEVFDPAPLQSFTVDKHRSEERRVGKE